MKDNAGWTPLHEACNHGNIQCVQELLKFVPAKTMEHYFKKGKKNTVPEMLTDLDFLSNIRLNTYVVSNHRHKAAKLACIDCF